MTLLRVTLSQLPTTVAVWLAWYADRSVALLVVALVLLCVGHVVHAAETRRLFAEDLERLAYQPEETA